MDNIIQFPGIQSTTSQMRNLSAETDAMQNSIVSLEKSITSLNGNGMDALSGSLSSVRGLFQSLGVELGSTPQRVLSVATATTQLISSMQKLKKLEVGERLAESFGNVKDSFRDGRIAISNDIKAIKKAFLQKTAGIDQAGAATQALTAKQNALALSTSKAAAKFNLLMGALLGSKVMTWLKIKATKVLKVALIATGLIAFTATLGLAVEGLRRLFRAMSNWVRSFGQACDATQELMDNVNDLKDSINASREAHKERRRELQREAQTTDDLIRRLRELQSQESMTNGQRVESERIARMLDERLGRLGITVDKSTGFLSESGAAAFKLAGHYADLGDATANLEENQKRLNEITEEFSEIDLHLYDLRAQLEETSETFVNLKYGIEVQNPVFARLQEQIYGLESRYYDLNQETKQLELQTYNTATRMAGLWDELAWQNSLSMETMTEAQRAVVEGFQSMYEISASTLGDLTQAFQENTDLTWEAVQYNQERIAAATKEHSELYAELVAAGVSEAYLQALGADRAESLPLIREMMADGIDAVQAREAEWLAAHEANADTFIDAFNFGSQHAAVIRNYMLGGIRDTFLDTVSQADFPSIGRSIPEQFCSGLELATANTVQTAKSSGRSIVDGLSEGVSAAGPQGVTTMTALVKRMQRVYSLEVRSQR